jgi:hypothetical protein
MMHVSPIYLFPHTYTNKHKHKQTQQQHKHTQDKSVHVLWQPKAWLDGDVARRFWVPNFEQDLQRLGLKGNKTLLLADNLGATKLDGYIKDLQAFNCKCMYGPKRGTEVWQPVDHGVGRRYQTLLAESYVEWTKSDECLELFETNKVITTG